MTPQVSAPSQAPSVAKDIVKQAITDGKAMAKEGKTKVEITNAMYQKLKNADRETAVAAFKERL